MKKTSLLLILAIVFISSIVNVQAENSVCNYIGQFQNNKFLQESGFDIENLIDPLTLAFCQNLTNILQEEKTTGKGKLKKDKEISINENRIIEKQGKGRVNFKNSFSVEIENVENDPNIYITENLIAINTEELPELNQPATITFYNLSFESTPTIYYNERFTTNPSELIEPCPKDICYNVNYDQETGTLTFDVAHFSSYAAWQWALGYNPNNPGGCSADADCKPTAYCAKYLDCWTGTEQLYGGSAPWREFHSCAYNPPAGIENAICDMYNLSALSINEPCPEGFSNIWEYLDYKWCAKSYVCNTCESTTACERHSCYVSVFNNCYSTCSSGDCWTNCMNNAYNACGGSSAWNGRGTLGVDYGTPESYYCQPRVCNADDVETGKCYYSGDSYNPEQTVNIGSKICVDKEQWQVCVEGDGDPCGEWETLEDDEIEVTTTDMYGLNTFTVDVCAGNSPPAININMKAKYSENIPPSVCDDLLCRIEIRDECYVSEVEYEVSGGHGSLANSFPNGVITGADDCIWDDDIGACVVELTIFRQYTNYGDVITCTAKTKDSCGAETMANSSITIAPKCG